MKASMAATRSWRNAYYKKLYVKMHYKELNQKLIRELESDIDRLRLRKAKLPKVKVKFIFKKIYKFVFSKYFYMICEGLLPNLTSSIKRI